MSQLPKGWTKSKLGEFVKLKNGFAFKSKDYLESGENTVPVVRISDIQNGKATIETASHIDSSKTDSKFLINKGDLLIAMSGATTGKTGVFNSDVEAYQNQRVGNLKLVDENNSCSKYRNYLIKSLQQDILKKAYGAAQPNISAKDLAEIEVTLAPFEDQKRISDKLDSVLGKVETAQARLDKIPTILKRFRQSVLAAATSGELTKDWRNGREFGKKVSIGELTKDIKYGTSKKCDYNNELTPVLRIPNISNGVVDSGDLKYAKFDDKQLEKLSLETGDILVIRSNGSVELVGKSALISDQHQGYLYAGYLIRLRLPTYEKALPAYLNIALQSPQLRKIIELNARSTSGVNNINSKELASLSFLLPEIKEQEEIINRVEILFDQAKKMERKHASGKAYLDSLTQSILSKAFSGRL
ncbi:restriction endonuclease subunit S [Marinomonas arenicola]|uniref:Restriction endonuclease subunit S n=1 Tax=Marinomonas arenicola TaxID=569601 RepID=A0ABU9G573_9GAMM